MTSKSPSVLGRPTQIVNLLLAISALFWGVLLLNAINSPGDITFVVSVGAILLWIFAAWKLVDFARAFRKNMSFRSKKGQVNDAESTPADTSRTLSAANFENVVQGSVVDHTTSQLHQKIPIR